MASAVSTSSFRSSLTLVHWFSPARLQGNDSLPPPQTASGSFARCLEVAVELRVLGFGFLLIVWLREALNISATVLSRSALG